MSGNIYERHQQLTPLHRLTRIYWLVRVPDYVSMLKNPMNDLIGIPTSGDRALDREMATTFSTKEHTIAELAELSFDGVPFELVNATDGSQMYTYIRDYFNVLNEKRQNRPGFSDNVSDEVLEKLNGFAEQLFPLVRDNHYRSDRQTQGFRRLRNMGRPMSRQTNVDNRKDDVQTEHKSLMEGLKEGLPKGNLFRD